MANEYGIFQSIVEGDQADAYRRRKYDEEKEKERRENSWRSHRGGSARYDVGGTRDKSKPYQSTEELLSNVRKDLSDADRWSSANNMAFNAALKSDKGVEDDGFEDFVDRARDGANRHLRRHPQKESSICDFV